MEYVYSSPIGPLGIVSDGVHITNIHLHATQETGHADGLILQVCSYLDDYFSYKHPTFPDMLLNPTGTSFQKKIWKLVSQIPYGTTVTYGEIAKQYCTEYGAKNMSAQAVGQAISANPIPILIPCHRVIGSKGKLVGYTGGLAVKSALLLLESNK